MSIAVGPYTTRAECDAKLPDALQEALDQYAEVCLGGQVEGPVLLPPDQLRQLVKDRWEEVRQYSVGPMVRLHVLFGFDRKVRIGLLRGTSGTWSPDACGLRGSDWPPGWRCWVHFTAI